MPRGMRDPEDAAIFHCDHCGHEWMGKRMGLRAAEHVALCTKCERRRARQVARLMEDGEITEEFRCYAAKREVSEE